MLRAAGSSLGSYMFPDGVLYSSSEPCPMCLTACYWACLRRVVFAWREPGLFVPDAQGYEQLSRAGLTVTELPEFAADAIAPNRHLVR